MAKKHLSNALAKRQASGEEVGNVKISFNSYVDENGDAYGDEILIEDLEPLPGYENKYENASYDLEPAKINRIEQVMRSITNDTELMPGDVATLLDLKKVPQKQLLAWYSETDSFVAKAIITSAFTGVEIIAPTNAIDFIPGGTLVSLTAKGTKTTKTVVRIGDKTLDALSDPIKSSVLRKTPGKVIGGDNLKYLTDGTSWLRGNQKNAGKVPKQIADNMAGKTYSSFDAFKKDFWNNVAGDPVLSKTFKPVDLGRMQKGLAPFADEGQRVGKSASYQLHHATPINKGGDVYNVDNITITTPRFHKEILNKDYHYGK